MTHAEMPSPIEEYSFGSIRIGGRLYRSDVIVYPDHITNWRRKEGHLLQVSDAASILSYGPDILVVGTGYYGAMAVSDDFEKLCKEKDVEIIACPTTEAWQIYNRFIAEGKRKVVAAFHLTC